MMDMKIDNGSFVIEDNGKVTVSKNIADKIKANYIVEDNEKQGEIEGVVYPFEVNI